MALKVKIEAFEGPFELLFHLIEKNQIDIYDIPIAELTDQYLVYLEDIDESQLDTASEFIVMAATLLSIKSRMLLPSTQNEEVQLELAAADEEIDPRGILVEKLLEYKRFKEVSHILKRKEKEQLCLIKKAPEDLSDLWSNDFCISNITLKEIKASFISVMNKIKKTIEIPEIAKDPIPLSVKIREVYRTLKKLKSNVLFSKLFEHKKKKEDIIVTFLAVLELIKMNRILATQEKQFGEIVLTFREV